MADSNIFPTALKTITVDNQAVFVSSLPEKYGIVYSHDLIGGFVEVPTIEHRNDIPSEGKLHPNRISTGRRKLGMIVYVKTENKFYQLRPNVGGVEITQADWDNSSDAKRVCLLDPRSANIFDKTTKAKVSGTGNPNDAWMELNIGLKGTGGGDDVIDQDFTVISTSVGSIKENETITKGTTVKSIIKRMLQKALPPTYNRPTVSATGWPASFVEMGLPITAFTITPAYTQNQGGPLIAYTYKKDGATVTSNIAGYNAVASTSFSVEASYQEGPILNDTTGSPSPDGHVLAGVASTSFTQTAIYPYFYGKSSTQPTLATIQAAITAKTGNKQLQNSNGTVSIDFGATDQYLWFATPDSSATKTKWYVSESNQGTIGAGANLFDSPTTPNIDGEYWSGVKYKVYISNYKTTATGTPMQMRNS